MIRLEKGNPPAFLTAEKVEELTAKFIQSKIDKDAGNRTTLSPVWREDDSIKEQALIESHNKCVYCECMVNAGGATFELEHFMPKNCYPELVVDWGNLMSSCDTCNTRKGSTTNKSEKEIINPFDDDPKEHLSYKAFRLLGKTDLGRKTIAKLDLNNRSRMVNSRFKVSDEANNQLHEINQIGDLDKLRNVICAILELCQPQEEYSVATASAIHHNNDYQICVEKLKNAELWDEHLELLHQYSLNILLD